MNQYQLEDNTLTLRVKTSPLFVRIVMFTFSFLCFILPITGIVLYISYGKGFHMGFLFLLFLFSLMGFYLLRMALWNTYGTEIISFKGHNVSYVANYGWFLDAQKTETIEPLVFQIQPIGYIEDKLGTLVIGDHDAIIESATKMPICDIEKLIEQLHDRFPNR